MTLELEQSAHRTHKGQTLLLLLEIILPNTVYGLKATAAEINDTTNAGGFAAAANTMRSNYN